MSKIKKIMFKAMIERKRLDAVGDDKKVAEYDKILRETNGKLDFK